MQSEYKEYYKGDLVWRVIECYGLNFNLGNALKYVCRAGKKSSNVKEDLQKAYNYINREIQYGVIIKTVRAVPAEIITAEIVITLCSIPKNLRPFIEMICKDTFTPSDLFDMRNCLESAMVLYSQPHGGMGGLPNAISSLEKTE